MRKSVLKMMVAVVCLFGLAVPAFAAEVSLLSALYQKEDYKSGGSDAGGKSTITIGGRYGDDLDTRMAWFGQGMLVMRSYDAPKGGEAPSGTTSLSMGGGLRLYFEPFSESVAPFLAAIGTYKNDKDSRPAGAGYITTEASGLYYGAAAGLRIGLDADFFIDLEAQIFESALFATEKEETVTVTRDNTTGVTTVTKSEDETSKTELYADTSATLFNTLMFSIGMKL